MEPLSNHIVIKTKKAKIITSIVIVLILLIAGFSIIKLYSDNSELQKEVKDYQEALKNSTDTLAQSEKDRENLVNALNEAGARNASFANQIDKITQTVESYERLKQIDPQLLQKYSKVYFLNENYTPSQLTLIDTKYLNNKLKPLEFHDRAWPFLLNMLQTAGNEGIQLQVISAYRSFGTQANLKTSYKVVYGAGTANQFSADQGYSEHQLGTTVDLTTANLGSAFDNFASTDGFTWMQKNAYRFGFVLSYPPNNKYYVYEPWHWRFVGLELALRLHNENKSFYDLDQREISEYLGKLFSGTVTASATSSSTTN